MNIRTWIDRIRDQATVIRGAYGTADLAAVSGEVSGNAYVYPLQEVSGQNMRGMNALEQQVTQRMAVVLVARNVRDGRGEAALTDLEAMRADLWRVLAGWRPGTGYEMVEHRRGALLSLDGATIWWQDEFETRFYRQAAGQ